MPAFACSVTTSATARVRALMRVAVRGVAIAREVEQCLRADQAANMGGEMRCSLRFMRQRYPRRRVAFNRPRG